MITVNGQQVDSLSKYRKVTGFVPQQDIMHRKLTVEEVLIFQGRLRLPVSLSAGNIKHRVDEIMKLLEIARVANAQIGDEVKHYRQNIEINPFNTITEAVSYSDSQNIQPNKQSFNDAVNQSVA